MQNVQDEVELVRSSFEDDSRIRYLRANPNKAERLESDEEQLREIVLQAAQNGCLDTLKKAVSVLRKMRWTHPCWRILQVTDRPFDFHDAQFYSPLMYACEAGHRPVVEYLLENAARVNYVGCQLTTMNKERGCGLTAMHVACMKGQVHIVDLLIERAKKSDALLKEVVNAKTFEDKWTPLMYAVKEGFVDVVESMLETKSVNILDTNLKCQTVLHIAGKQNQLNCLKVVHKNLQETDARIADVEGNPYLQTDEKGQNVLHHVCSGTAESGETLRWLLEVMPHLKNKEILMMTTTKGLTALHLAAIRDYSGVARVLIEQDISLTAQDPIEGDTALHTALKNLSLEVADIIRTSEGAEELKRIRNKEGKTPDEISPDNIIPKEIAQLGDDKIEKYKQVLRKGKKKKMPRCNLVVLGKEHVGKTSLLRLVLGKKFIQDIESTRGIDNELCVVDVKTISSSGWKETQPEVQATDLMKQFYRSLSEELKILFFNSNKGERDAKERSNNQKQEKAKEGSDVSPHQLQREMDEISQHLDMVQQEISLCNGKGGRSIQQPVTAAPDEQPAKEKTVISSSQKPKHAEMDSTGRQSPSPPESIPEALPVSEVPTGSQMTSQPSPSASNTPIEPENAPVHNHMPIEISPKDLKSVLSTAKETLNEDEPKLHFNTLDFAGQKEYRPMHHCFIVRRALYLVVFNLQTFLEALKSADKGERNALDKELEEIKYWLSSIHAHLCPKSESDLLVRVILVGTHKAPSQDKIISEEEMWKINKALEDNIQGAIKNDLRFVCPSGTKKPRIFAAVENSLDKESDREESGVDLVQSEILEAWETLPFKDELYPTSWLRFEAFLNSIRSDIEGAVRKIKQSDASPVQPSFPEIWKHLLLEGNMHMHITNLSCMKEVARRCHIEDDEMELAFAFYHETGTLVCIKQLPALYLNPSEKEKLNDIILLDQRYLLQVMRIVMELDTEKGRGNIPTTAIDTLRRNGTIKSSTLKKCWASYCRNGESFNQLCLILQSFCLIFPVDDSQAAQCSAGPPPTQSTVQKQNAVLPHGKTDGDLLSKEDKTYLIPSMLPDPYDSSAARDTSIYDIHFCFDFGGFLPAEVYHRLLCLMLRDQKATFKNASCTAQHFQVIRVFRHNWMVEKLDTKLNVYVTYNPAGEKFPRSWFFLLMHKEYLSKICDEEKSSLRGLEYTGGPGTDVSCPSCERPLIPFLSYPSNSKDNPEAVTEVKCTNEKCSKSLLIEDVLKKGLKERCICCECEDALSFEVQCEKCGKYHNMEDVLKKRPRERAEPSVQTTPSTAGGSVAHPVTQSTPPLPVECQIRGKYHNMEGALKKRPKERAEPSYQTTPSTAGGPVVHPMTQSPPVSSSPPILWPLAVVFVLGIVLAIILVFSPSVSIKEQSYRDSLSAMDQAAPCEQTPTTTMAVCTEISDVKLLFRELSECTHWKDLGRELGFSEGRISDIESDNSYMAEKRRALYRMWFDGEERACWEQIIRALRAIKQNRKAGELEAKYTLNNA